MTLTGMALTGGVLAGVALGAEQQLSTDNWLTIIGFAVMATIYIVNSRSGNKILSNKLEMIDGTMENFQKEITKLNEVLVTQAVQNSHIGMLEQRLLQEGRRIDNISRAMNQVLFKMAIPSTPLLTRDPEEPDTD